MGLVRCGFTSAKMVTFSLDGVDYETDLSDKAGLAEVLAPFITAGRLTGRTSSRSRNGTARPSSDRLTVQRAWASQS